METIDPATGRPLPADAIQRILFIANSVHVYNIPPLASLKGYTAATWTEDPKRHIFTCRIRIVETSVTLASGDDQVKADVILEDPSNGQLFAAAPYTSPAVVEPTLDSSRFFALRVQDPSGRKATLGIGFEERSESFDFGVGLQEAQKALGIDAAAGRGDGPAGKVTEKPKVEEKRDYSLKEGETITVNLGGTKLGRKPRPVSQQQDSLPAGASLSSFALPPPPSGNTSRAGLSLPPPPSASAPAGAQGGDTSGKPQKSAQDLGFDDGQFGEFA